MKKLKIVISLIIMLALTSSVVMSAPQELKVQYNDYGQQEQNNSERTVLTGKVTQVQELPSGMYGMWQVNGTLLDTNDYTKYSTRSSDIWVLKKNGNFVTLMNPQNGASATITVTAVEDNTATFIRKQKTNVSSNSEQVTLTLQGDTFYGTDMIVNQDSYYGITQTTVARYKVNGVKISGQTLYKPKTNREFGF